MTYGALLSETKAARAWGLTLSEWVEEPRWARKYMYAEYQASMHIDAVVAEDARMEAEK